MTKTRKNNSKRHTKTKKRVYRKKFSTLVKHFKTPFDVSNVTYKKTKSFNRARVAALERINYNARNLFGQISTITSFKPLH